MKKKFKLGIIGAGFMASAIIQGVLKSKNLTSESIIVSDLSEDALLKAKENFNVLTTSDNAFLCDNSEFILFAVKPQSLSAVMEEIKNSCAEKFISIMAGIKRDKIRSFFPKSMIARCMPNTPCSIGFGAIGIDLSDYKNENDRYFIRSIFSSLGEVVELSEDKLNAVTGISGSSPAYFYLFLKGIIDAGIKAGLTETEAKHLAVNTMIGSGEMVKKNENKTLDELINAVCSKGGTTIQAVDVFKNGKLDDLIYKAVDACIKRSYELENL